MSTSIDAMLTSDIKTMEKIIFSNMVQTTFTIPGQKMLVDLKHPKIRDKEYFEIALNFCSQDMVTTPVIACKTHKSVDNEAVLQISERIAEEVRLSKDPVTGKVYWKIWPTLGADRTKLKIHLTCYNKCSGRKEKDQDWKIIIHLCKPNGAILGRSLGAIRRERKFKTMIQKSARTNSQNDIYSCNILGY